MSDWIIHTITLPGDLLWTDEHWSPTKQAEDLSLAGGLLVQRSTQQSGRPITLDTYRGVFVTRAEVLSLEALRDDSVNQKFAVTAPDGKTYQCRFRHGDGPPVDAAPIHFRSPPAPEDIYNLTLRLMTA